MEHENCVVNLFFNSTLKLGIKPFCNRTREAHFHRGNQIHIGGGGGGGGRAKASGSQIFLMAGIL